MYIELAYPEQQRTIDGTGKLTSATIQYLVFEASDEAEALQYAFGAIDKELEDLKLLSVSISERKSEDVFLLDAEYGVSSRTGGGSSSDDEEEEEATVNFDCNTGSAHVNMALATVKNCFGFETGGAISWNGKQDAESEISGTDIAVATLTETYTKRIKVKKLTNSFRRKIAELTSCINSSSFKGWSAGEVMFCGCSFTAPEEGAEEVTVSFNFAIRPNDKVIVQGVDYGWKYGWDYLDVISKPDFDKSGKPSVDIRAINVLRVYRFANFSSLGL